MTSELNALVQFYTRLSVILIEFSSGERLFRQNMKKICFIEYSLKNRANDFI